MKKLSINTLALGNLRERKKQYTVLILSIILAMIFVSGVPFFLSCLSSSQEELRIRRYGKQDYIYLNAQESFFSAVEGNETVESKPGYMQVTSFVFSENASEEKGAYVGKLDIRARELYHQILLEGEYPQNDSEIAVEKTTLQRLGDNLKPGDSITLSEKSCDTNAEFSEARKKTYTLTGILSDKLIYLENLHGGAYNTAKLIPSVFTAGTEDIARTGNEKLIALVEAPTDNKHHGFFAFEAAPGNTLDTSDINITSLSDPYYKLLNSMGIFIFLTILLALLSCFAIVNAFNSVLKERKNQIGLFKAVGATKRQIINIFGREALLISLFSAPVSIITAYFSVKLITKIAGESFIFIPDMTVLLSGGVSGIISVMGAALIPLIKISSLSPLQAIRDIEILRKVKKQKITSRKSFSPPKLLAKRKLVFSGRKRMLVCTILAVTVVLCSLTGSVIRISAKDTNTKTNYDYKVYDFYADDEMAYSHNSYVNLPSEEPISEGEKSQLFDIPYIEKVHGKKTVRVNLLFDGKIPQYLTVNDIYSVKTSTKYPEARHILQKILEQTDARNEAQDKTAELLDAVFNDPENTVNPYYNEIKVKAGYTEEIFNTVITAENEALIADLKNNVIDGEIDIKKLNSGEEIIMRAPDEIGLSLERPAGEDSGYLVSIKNMAFENSKELSKNEKKVFQDVVLRADRPYKAGDKIKISILESDGSGSFTRTDKEYTVGAIIGKGQYDGVFGLITTLSGFDALGISRPYNSLEIYLDDECDSEIDNLIMTKLTAILPGKDIESSFIINESQKNDFKTRIISLVSLVLVFGVICISLISNTVTADIRESKRTLGTLRAVGCSERELFYSYSLQLTDIFLWGIISGFIIYIITLAVINTAAPLSHIPFSVLPLLILSAMLIPVSFINLNSKLKSVTKYSIVENIREL